MVKDLRCVGVLAACDICAGLLVEPPTRQPEFGGCRPRFLQHDAVGLENRVDVARSPTRVIGKRHRRTAEDVQVCHDSPAGQALAEPAEGILDGATVKERVVSAHATSSSCAATYTPRRRKAAGAFTTASTRAARVLNGNQN